MIWPILAKIWLPWQRALNLAIRNVFFRLDNHEDSML